MYYITISNYTNGKYIGLVTMQTENADFVWQLVNAWANEFLPEHYHVSNEGGLNANDENIHYDLSKLHLLSRGDTYHVHYECDAKYIKFDPEQFFDVFIECN